MKKLLLLSLSLLACDFQTETSIPLNFSTAEITQFKQALVAMDEELLSTYFDPIMSDLKPKISASDPDGHSYTTTVFVDRLNKHFDITAQLKFYALIETFPTQSEIAVNFSLNDVQYTRILDLLNRRDAYLKFHHIHE